MSGTSGLLVEIASVAPTLLVLLAGVVLCLMLRPRAPRAALIALSALGLLLIQLVALRAVIHIGVASSWLASPWWMVVAVAQGLGHALALAMLVAAVFVDRTAAEG